MIRFFSSDAHSHVLIDYPYTDEDRKALVLELAKNYEEYHIEFGRIYILDVQSVSLLYSELYTNKKNIRITTHTRRLKRYLKKMSIKTLFVSLVKNYVLHTKNIEVVLIGGSADSSPKIVEIVKSVQLQNLSLVIVQHIDPHKEGHFDAILQEYTHYKVQYAQDSQKVEKENIYLAPKNKHLKIVDGCFVLSQEEKYNFSRPSISLSYQSFSDYYKEKLLVIQECGYASDGVDKMQRLKENNSLLVVQDSSECKATDMLNHALNLGVHDYVFKLKDIIEYINFLNKSTSKKVWLEYLLYKIYERYTYDFRTYHRGTLERRLDVFMLHHEIKNMKDAVGIILFNPIAFKSFFLEVSINVTEFFRKPHSLKQTIDVISEKYKHTSHLKLWSAGCSSGEEVYSLAIALESLGHLEKSIVYATDFNKVILEEAKNALYPLESLEVAKNNLSSMGLNTCFDNYILQNNYYFQINEKIKKKILFFQHNLATDASFNEFDIIMCKNVIIYFDSILQDKVFQLFYDSLTFGGYLVLGESEGLSEKFRSKFKQHSDDYKIFQKVA